MNTKISQVLAGFKNLTDEERKEFYEIIKGFEEYPHSTNKKINESFESISVNKSSVNFGPSPSGCPCCGKG